jgi:hypothetical protein
MSTSSTPANLEGDMGLAGSEPKQQVPDLPADNGSIPKISESEAWGTDKLPVTETPTPFKNLR